MTERNTAAPTQIENHGWRVTFAGMGINLALGVLYSWSIISAGMEKEWGWTAVARSRPYSFACLVFCLIMVPAGRMQDKLSPRLVAAIGGVLVGTGMVLASFLGNSQLGWIVGFGILAGAGIGFGYASATPPAVKWFPAAKTGLIAGLVVSGFGLASVYIAPLGNWLIARYGIETTAMTFGIGFFVVVVGLAQFLKPPPAGYIPAGQPPKPKNSNKKEDFTPSEMLKTWQFYLLWFMYACGAGAGLMVISVAKNIGKVSGAGVMVVTALAIGNGAGRIVAGVLSDKLGRKTTLFLFFVFQAIMVILLAAAAKGGTLGAPAILSIMAALVGANYGSNLSLFPSATKDYYGLKDFGMNYGLVFTAWGIGGYVLSQFAASVYDGKIIESWKGSFDFAFYCSAGLLILAAIAVFMLKPPHHTIEPEHA
ncbi:MAG: OFA family MFS transporter [Sedimentisphaerales bacterium]|nr:OFA family MFS transporter [Sedimentisphaerales bacterium]